MPENTWKSAAGADGFIGLREDRRPFSNFRWRLHCRVDKSAETLKICCRLGEIRLLRGS